jgi:hypothetical protein
VGDLRALEAAYVEATGQQIPVEGPPLIVPCQACGTEGQRYAGHPNDPHPRQWNLHN